MTKKKDYLRDSEQRGSAGSSPEPRFLVIGQIGKAHGVRGEMRVIPHTDMPERFTWLETVYVGEVEKRPLTVENARMHKNFVLLKLAGYDYRDQVDALRNKWLLVPEEEAIPLAENEYFLYQLIGLQVFQESGELLGELVDVIETAAHNVFTVQMAEQQLLLPDSEEVVREIDFDNGRMIVHLLPGLLPRRDS